LRICYFLYVETRSVIKAGEEMNWKKIRFYIKLHWIKALLTIILSALAVSLVFLVITGYAPGRIGILPQAIPTGNDPLAAIPADHHGPYLRFRIHIPDVLALF
jgi:hypothetical protein